MRIAIVSDAWTPQVNGVVRTLQAVSAELRKAGHTILVIAPDAFRSWPCPTYPEIRLALATPRRIGASLTEFGADAIHIATEGPLGVMARRWCLRRSLPFTTAYHTHFPDYIAARTQLSASWIWRYVRWFHNASTAVLTSTTRVAAQLRAQNIDHVRAWTRGVDTEVFRADGPVDAELATLPRPIQLYVGRVAVEKNLAAFLGTAQRGSKVIVGDGPARAQLQAAFPTAHFVGTRSGDALAACYRAADVFVFPSRTDTFGLVMIEALACGTPVAAYPVAGPLDVLTDAVAGIDEDLDVAIAAALQRAREVCSDHGRRFSWAESARQFVAALQPVKLDLAG